MEYRAECEFDLGDESEIIIKSLLPEVEEAPSEKTEVSISLSNSKIMLSISAGDITSLRAALNTWLRLMRVASDMAKLKHL